MPGNKMDSDQLNLFDWPPSEAAGEATEDAEETADHRSSGMSIEPTDTSGESVPGTDPASVMHATEVPFLLRGIETVLPAETEIHTLSVGDTVAVPPTDSVPP